MGFLKFGAKEKLQAIVINKDEFEKTRETINTENNLIRCPKCGHLISKTANQLATLQHKGSISIIKLGSIQTQCVDCGSIIEIK